MKSFIHFWLFVALALLPAQGQGILSLAGSPPAAVVVTPVSPGLTSIVAWYDFADATDADGGTYNLAPQNTPTYTAGPPSYGTATDGTPGAYWQQVALDDNFGNISGNWSMVLRFRAHKLPPITLLACSLSITKHCHDISVGVAVVL